MSRRFDGCEDEMHSQLHLLAWDGARIHTIIGLGSVGGLLQASYKELARSYRNRQASDIPHRQMQQLSIAYTQLGQLVVHGQILSLGFKSLVKRCQHSFSFNYVLWRIPSRNMVALVALRSIQEVS